MYSRSGGTLDGRRPFSAGAPDLRPSRREPHRSHHPLPLPDGGPGGAKKLNLARRGPGVRGSRPKLKVGCKGPTMFAEANLI